LFVHGSLHLQGPDDRKTEPRPASQEKQKIEERTLIPGLKKHRNGNSKLKSSSGTAGGFEKYQGHHNGVNLTRIKSSDDYEEQLRTDKREAKLVSGRKAGQGWERSGIRFAPLNLPLRRRLQTMMVLFHTLCIAVAVSFFFFMCAVPLFWPLLIPYMIYCMLSNASTSGTLSSRSDFLRSLRVWSLFASYFPARLHRSQELPATRKYIFGYHPHGIISHGAFAAFATEALGFKQLFPGITNTLLTLDSNFRIPIYRDYALAMGLASVSKESCENILSKGGPNNVRFRIYITLRGY
jgi:2-acylglycerol O-acyltransferase 2